MNCAPTTTVATPTMAAAAVPSAACARHRLGIERPRLTVVIGSTNCFCWPRHTSRLLDAGVVVVGASHQTA
jgi:hypothetical protein